MNPVTAFDDWMIAQHQKVADRAYSRWEDVSPYWIAAQLFGLVAVLAILRIGYAFTSGENPSIFGISIYVLMPMALYSRAMLAHEIWRRAKDAVPQQTPIADMLLRFLFLYLTAKAAWTIYQATNIDLTTSAVIITVLGSAATTGQYFLACKPPTFVDRRKHILAPQAT